MNKQGKIKIHFLGAAGTVTGSKFLIDTGERKIMIDCGLFQGLKKLRLLNWDLLPFNVDELDAVILTHGHLDHTGFLPRLVNLGYSNKIYGTAPTLQIAEIILRDSAKIQEEEANKANREGYSKHKPAKPMYTVKDAEKTLTQFKALNDGQWIQLFQGIKMRLQFNGHIIGAAFVEIEISGKRFVFSGDIGRKEDILLQSYKRPQKADVLFIESTYGGKNHPKDNIETKLKNIILNTFKKGGTLIIPSFAVERAQTLMYLLWQLQEKNEIPFIPLIMDSPMGANVLDVFQKNSRWHKLSEEDCEKMCKAFRIVRDYKETIEIIKDVNPKIVIAGSGMLSGGRVLSYLEEYLNKPETTVLLSGFQAEGTRGRKLLEGAAALKIYGKYHEVKAEIINVEVLSSHADQTDLIDWLSNIKEAPENIFIIHGESHSADALRLKIKDTYDWDCTIPELYEIVEISF